VFCEVISLEVAHARQQLAFMHDIAFLDLDINDNTPESLQSQWIHGAGKI
jgi:hypothetical protein